METHDEEILDCLRSIAESLAVIASALQPKTPKPEMKSPTPKRFVKPTIEEIEAYVREKGYNVDAERFFNYYESKGWFVGKSPMKNWRAAVATWEKSSADLFGNLTPPETKPEPHTSTSDIISDPQMMEIIRMGRERYKNL